ncbi:MAG TPA: M24 family metallopeptidase [Stellaceae bacterium]|nr:M24 family metallopeptidase [Stellaceae bacterium]
MPDERIFRQRIARLRQTLLAPLGLDMLLAYADDTLDAGAVRYLTDFDVYAMYALVLVPRCGDVALAFGLHHSAYLVRVRDAATADYFHGTYAPGELCRRLLAETAPASAPRIGIVGGARMMRRIDADLRQHLPGAEFVAVDEAFRRLVAGSDVEDGASDCLRRSAAIARQSIAAAATAVGQRSGREIAAEIGFAARRFGADVLNREMVLIALAAGSPLPERLGPAAAAAQVKDALAIEVSPGYRGYRTLCGRTFLASAERAAQRARLEAAFEVHREICALVQPGLSAGGVADKARSILARAGSAPAPDAKLGHGIGLSLIQEPILRSGNPAEILPGSALAVRTRHGGDALGTIHLADTVLVTAEGGEVLTAPAR